MAELIGSVSDTALWVATYRADETARPDALFRDPFAARLAGDEGRRIAAGIKGGRYAGWSVIIRTCIIDDFIRALVAEGVDTVLNLGAGLDARPQRLDLPAALHWIEVDYPHVIALKEERLRDAPARCRLERVALDLADAAARRALFARVAAESRHAAVLTEGVVPYLSDAETAALAADLRACPPVRAWIVDYIAPRVRRWLNRLRTRGQFKNAPLRFDPDDWFAFFAAHGWRPRAERYYAEESERLGRAVPRPWWVALVRPLLSARRREALRRASGYFLLERAT